MSNYLDSFWGHSNLCWRCFLWQIDHWILSLLIWCSYFITVLNAEIYILTNKYITASPDKNICQFTDCSVCGAPSLAKKLMLGWKVWEDGPCEGIFGYVSSLPHLTLSSVCLCVLQPSTLPQGTINMNQCSDVIDGESRTGQKNSLCILTPEKEHFIRAECKEIING